MTIIQQMIEAIYQKIADKNLSFWCKCYVEKFWYCKFLLLDQNTDWTFPTNQYLLDNWRVFQTPLANWDRTIIWHPVMIWDVMNYSEKYFLENPVKCQYCKDKQILRYDSEDQVDRCMNINNHSKRMSEVVDNNKLKYFLEDLQDCWEHKRKTIEEQPDYCIKFVFDNLNLWKQENK